mmetsp:Transcript_5493/g.8369  ORF Transcript_5493/g.8369 Transcript_5493/m.8369 type:complete len:879 (-) Transcript_5493:165-2801(-)|eukprot:CAMPEP_0185034174 /NCGR_PEP_ID=MMETSP1103-20130426/23804_1 /TAXON_ID=36769 /ORGANISM="Paraphysomonas bandaiensis, Strain Caron Lab Isolate" /LENGTH=878 /DNA_ID=CAMNT_0027570719 /DNA_START=45 /DNA_END=2681 /DNA_ORIENTATION=-
MEFELDKKSLDRVIMGYLRRHGMFDTLCMLAMETGLSEVERGNEALHLQQLILEGRWDDVLAYLSPLKKYVAQFDKVEFVIRKQQYLEALCWQGAKDTLNNVTPWRPLRHLSEGGYSDVDDEITMDRVVEVLKSLEDLCSQVEFNKLCNCLTFASLTESPDFSDWSVTQGRFQCIDVLWDLLQEVLPRSGSSPISYPEYGLEEIVALGLEGCVVRARGIGEENLSSPIPVTVDKTGLLYPDIPGVVPSSLPVLTLSSSSGRTHTKSRNRDIPRSGPDSSRSLPASSRPDKQTESPHIQNVKYVPPVQKALLLTAEYPSKPPVKWTVGVDDPPPGDSRTDRARWDSQGPPHHVDKEKRKAAGWSIDFNEDGGCTRDVPVPPALNGTAESARAGPNSRRGEKVGGGGLSSGGGRGSGVKFTDKYERYDELDIPAERDEGTVFSANTLTTDTRTVSTAGVTASTKDHNDGQRGGGRGHSHSSRRAVSEHKPALTAAPRDRGKGRVADRPCEPEMVSTRHTPVRWSEVRPQGIEVHPVCIWRDTTPLRCVTAFSSQDPLEDSLVTDDIDDKSGHVSIAIGSNANTVSILGMKRPSNSVHIVSELKGVHHGEKCSIYTCDWSGDGELLATGSNDRLIRVIRRSGRSQDSAYGVSGTFKDHNGTVRTVRFSPHDAGTQLASGGAGDCRLRLWDVQTGSCTKMAAHQAHIHGISWLEPNIVLTGCDKGLLLAQDTRVGSVAWSIDLGSNICSCYSLRDIGMTIVGHANGSVSLVDTRERQLISSYSLHGTDVRSVGLWNETPFGGLCAVTTSFDGTGGVWRLQSSTARNSRGDDSSHMFVKIASLVGHTDKILCSAICSSTGDIFTSGADGNVMCWNPEGHKTQV